MPGSDCPGLDCELDAAAAATAGETVEPPWMFGSASLSKEDQRGSVRVEIRRLG